METRFDRVPLKAHDTEEGYLRDTPVLTRSGVFSYAEGRKEYRPDNVVFAPETLARYMGLPITNGHPGMVSAANVKEHVAGTVLTEGRQDGRNLIAEVVVYDKQRIAAGDKELSVGYSVELDETPGETEDGERYDAIQTKIIPNHIAIVTRGRAGNARFNMDEEDNMEEEMNELQERLDAAEAKVAEAEETIAAFDPDGIRKQARARAELEAVASQHDVRTDGEDSELRRDVIVAIMGKDVRLDGKSDEYVEAMFDIAVHQHKQREDQAAGNRQALAEKADSKVLTADEIRAKSLKETYGV